MTPAVVFSEGMGGALNNSAVTEKELRNSGIDIIGHHPWGSHFCNFYESKADLLEILVPYYKVGLENNEFCLWVTSEPVSVDDAVQALRKVLPDIDLLIQNKRIEILPYDQWYLNDGEFSAAIVLKKLLKKMHQVLESGFDGMRVHGNESWLPPEIWQDFMSYEKQLNNTLFDSRILVLCTYPLAKCDAASVLDVAKVHECAVAKRHGEWEMLEIPEVKITKGKVNQHNIYLEKLIEERTLLLAVTNKELKKEIAKHKKTLRILKKAEGNYREIFDKASDAIFVNELGTGKIIDVNKKACKITGYTKEEFIDGRPSDFSSMKEGYTLEEGDAKIRQVVTEGDQNFEWQFRYKDGTVHWIEVSLTIANIGGVKRILSFFHEIDDRKAAEQKLEEERNEKQRAITDAVITAEENERQEIGRELHDNIQQILMTSRLYLDIAKKTEIKDPHPYIDEVHEMISNAIKELRNLSHTMISPFQEDNSLFDALNQLANTISKTTGLSIDISIGNINENSIPEKVRLAIYRIVQEQFTNVIKHAEAKNVKVRLYSQQQTIILSIKDDGIGFNTSKKAKGFGLINLRTRASLCNGEMHIVSAKGKGCELIVNFNCGL